MVKIVNIPIENTSSWIDILVQFIHPTILKQELLLSASISGGVLDQWSAEQIHVRSAERAHSKCRLIRQHVKQGSRFYKVGVLLKRCSFAPSPSEIQVTPFFGAADSRPHPNKEMKTYEQGMRQALLIVVLLQIRERRLLYNNSMPICFEWLPPGSPHPVRALSI